MPGECEPHGLDQDGQSLWIGAFWADASEGQPMVDTAYHCSRAEGDGKDRWQNSHRIQRTARGPGWPREKIGRRYFRTPSARSQKRYSLQEHPRETAGVVAPLLAEKERHRGLHPISRIQRKDAMPQQ